MIFTNQLKGLIILSVILCDMNFAVSKHIEPLIIKHSHRLSRKKENNSGIHRAFTLAERIKRLFSLWKFRGVTLIKMGYSWVTDFI